jgi:Protein of unknown function (DUF541)
MATVTVRGVGEARTGPDEASGTLTIETIEQKAAALLAKVAERTQAALELCDAGIEPAAHVTRERASPSTASTTGKAGGSTRVPREEPDCPPGRRGLGRR